MQVAREGYSPQRGKAKPGALSRRAMGRARAPQHRTVHLGTLDIVVDDSVLPDWRDVAEHMEEHNVRFLAARLLEDAWDRAPLD